MSRHSIADAKATLPRLIDRAMAGEDVVITRHGKPVAEIRPATTLKGATRPGAHDWYLSRRLKLPQGAPTSVELLNMIYDDPDV